MALIDSQIRCEIDFKFKEQNYCRLFDQVMWKEPGKKECDIYFAKKFSY